MSHTPPVPAGNQSPYPLQEPPHHARTTDIAVPPTPAPAPAPVSSPVASPAPARPRRWTLFPILTASLTVAATLGAAALLLFPSDKPRD